MRLCVCRFGKLSLCRWLPPPSRGLVGCAGDAASAISARLLVGLRRPGGMTRPLGTQASQLSFLPWAAGDEPADACAVFVPLASAFRPLPALPPRSLLASSCSVPFGAARRPVSPLPPPGGVLGHPDIFLYHLSSVGLPETRGGVGSPPLRVTMADMWHRASPTLPGALSLPARWSPSSVQRKAVAAADRRCHGNRRFASPAPRRWFTGAGSHPQVIVVIYLSVVGALLLYMAFLMLVDPLIRKPDAYTEQLRDEEENEVTGWVPGPCQCLCPPQGPGPPACESPAQDQQSVAGPWGHPCPRPCPVRSLHLLTQTPDVCPGGRCPLRSQGRQEVVLSLPGVPAWGAVSSCSTVFPGRGDVSQPGSATHRCTWYLGRQTLVSSGL